MEKIIYVLDGNCRKVPELDEWLKLPRNFVALTDFSAIEIYKGDEPRGMEWSMEVLAKHPAKVIVLKPTAQVLKIPGIDRGLRRRLIDHPTTSHYPQYCKDVFAATTNPLIADELAKRSVWAKEHMQVVRKSVDGMAGIVKVFAANYSRDEREIIRLRQRYPITLIRKVLDTIYELATLSIKQVQPSLDRVDGKIHNYYAFRYSMCSFLQMLKVIGNGGGMPANEDKIINDFLDNSYAAYATYFDGLFSRDQKLVDTYMEARALLAQLTRVV